MELHRHINREDWNGLILHSDYANYFQTPDYYDFLCTQPHLSPFCLAVYEQQKPMALLCGYVLAHTNPLKAPFSRRAVVQGGVLLRREATDEHLKCLLKEWKRLLEKKVIYMEIRNFLDYAAIRKTMEEEGFHYQPHYDIHLTIGTREEVMQRMDEPKRRQIRKAYAQGENWRATRSTDDLKAFYLLLQRLYKTKVHRPLFPITFFEGLLATEHAWLLVTENASKTITGGMVCVGYERKVLYEWFVCGDVMATWAGLDFAAQNGYDYFDFMGAGVPEQPYPVRDFKMRFGGTLHEYGRFLHIAKPFMYHLGEWVVKHWKTLV